MDKTNAEHEIITLSARTTLEDDERERLKYLISLRPDWNEIYSLASTHLVTPLLLRSLRATGTLESVPTDIVEPMVNSTMRNLAHNMQRSLELIRVLDALSSEEITAVILKGPALTNAVYHDESLRIYSDIDLLIERHELSRAKEIVAGLGYSLVRDNYSVADDLNEELGCEWTYYHPKAVLEIHWNIVDKLSRFNINVQELIDRAVVFDMSGRQELMLSPEDMLLHLCIHQYKHHWQRLRDLCDIAEIARQYSKDFDWRGFLTRSSSADADKSVYYTLLLAQHILDAPVPKWVLDSLDERTRKGVISRSIFSVIEKNVLSYTSPHGYWPVILADSFGERLGIIRHATGQQALERDENERIVPNTRKTGIAGFWKKLTRTILSIFEYQRLLLQLAAALFRTTFRRQSGN
jgi:hypothetical protein